MTRYNALFDSLVVEAKDPLAKYKSKRKFDETSEPEGKETKSGNKHRFVIQLHHAKKVGCLSGEVRVITDKGPIYIGNIVRKKIQANVLSWNPNNNSLEWQPIINWFDNGSTDEWLHIKAEGKCGIFVTHNHIIYKIDKNGKIIKSLAKDLKINDNICVGDESVSNNKFEFLVGALLGDGSIKNKKFIYGHIIDAKNMVSKVSELFDQNIEIRKAGKQLLDGKEYNKKEFHYIRKTHFVNKVLSGLFYDDNHIKIIKDEMLGHITAKSIAVWFMDDGQWSPAKSYFGNNKFGGPPRNLGRNIFAGQILLHTLCFSKKDCEKLSNMLYNKFEVKSTVVGTFSKKYKKVYYHIAINDIENNKKFFVLVAPFLHEDFQYKSPIRVGGMDWLINNNSGMCLFPKKIIEIKQKIYYSKGKGNIKYKTKNKKFDIEVANNHNYFAGGMLVSNSHYDLRLENDDGALSSWSVPKHYLPKGKEKLLAIKTEDHPVEYLKFKGEIPAGYGAGTVEIHDSGTYEEIEASKTKIVFHLKGKKEKGTYRLFRAGDGNKWLIMNDAGEKKASILPFSKIAKKHTGAMLAIMAPPEIVRKMRKANMVDDKDISDVLHMTLLYLGPSAKLRKATLEAIKRAAEKVCARHDPLKMHITGAGIFTPGDEGTPVYVVPNAKGLSALQADLENVIGSIVDLPSEHGWAPHMTVGYSCDDKPELPDLVGKFEWTADKVRLQAGGEKVADIPIGRRKRGNKPPISKRAGFDPDKLADDDPPESTPIKPEEIPFSKRPTIEMACPYCYTDVSGIKPEQTPAGLYKMMTCPECKGAFYPQDALVAAKETGKKKLDVGEWPESGWFLMMIGLKPMGFIQGDAAANLVLGRWTEMAAKGNWGPVNLDSIANQALSKVENMLQDPFGKPSLGGRALWELAKRQGVGLDKRLNELMTHPMYEKTRRELAGRIGNLVPMPPSFKPAPESRIAGFPTDETAEYADVQIDSLLGHLDDTDDAHKKPGQRRFESVLGDAQAKANNTFNDMADEMAKPVVKRLKWLLEQEGKIPKPEEMADDLWTDEDDAAEMALLADDSCCCNKL